MQATLSHLTPEQLDAFARDGYFVAEQAITPAEVDEARETFTTYGEAGPVEGVSEGHAANYADADPLKRWPRMLHPHRQPDTPAGSLALKYMLDPRVAGPVSDLLGDQAVAAQSMFYFKPPGARGQGPHQDNLFLRVSPGTCMAAWMAVDDCDEDNGCLFVAPGTQDMEVLCPDVDAPDREMFFTGGGISVEGRRLRQVPLKAGDVLYFNGSIVHGSFPNTTADRFRRSLIYHYIPAGCAEVAGFYHPLLALDGTVVSKPVAEGGGPCGDAIY